MGEFLGAFFFFLLIGVQFLAMAAAYNTSDSSEAKDDAHTEAEFAALARVAWRGEIPCA